jgi:hypothetical protein
MRLLAVDPSITSAGAALFFDGVLASAEEIAGAHGANIPIRAAYMAVEIDEWCSVAIDTLVIEWPGRSWRGDARDLYGLCAVAGALVARYPDAAVYTYEPGEWSGGTTKIKTRKDTAKSVRARRIRSRLSPGELEVWETIARSDDAIDAIGLGLHHLGRLTPRKIYPGAVSPAEDS